MISLRGVRFRYPDNPEGNAALSGIDLDIADGAFTAILGASGSGKSTLAKILDALLIPTAGTVSVDDLVIDSAARPTGELLMKVRSTVGMVFQNPVNQIIGDTVEQDVAYGPSNLGLDHAEIVRRTDAALRTMGLVELRLRNPAHLSGGQMQRLAIAGALAMGTRHIVLDESLSMLDPQGRDEVLANLRRLNREEGLGIIMISHDARDCAGCDRFIVLDKGRIAMEGSPEDLALKKDVLRALGVRTC